MSTRILTRSYVRRTVLSLFNWHSTARYVYIVRVQWHLMMQGLEDWGGGEERDSSPALGHWASRI